MRVVYTIVINTILGKKRYTLIYDIILIKFFVNGTTNVDKPPALTPK